MTSILSPRASSMPAAAATSDLIWAISSAVRGAYVGSPLPSLAGVHLPSTATATASFLTSPGSLVVVVVVLEIS